MSTFALVHGAWHAGWCWERLEPELRARGHEVVVADYPCEDGTATLLTYADAVANAIPPTEDLVLVGHSLGACVVPLVAERVGARAIVFLCGVLPKLGGLPWDDGPAMEASGITDPLVRADDGSARWPSIESAAAAFYADCSPEDAAWAFEQLRAQNSSSLWNEPYPLAAWPDVPLHSIATTEDRIVLIEWSRFAARERLGIEVIELPGSHSPFLSRPAQLGATLDTI